MTNIHSAIEVSKNCNGLVVIKCALSDLLLSIAQLESRFGSDGFKMKRLEDGHTLFVNSTTGDEWGVQLECDSYISGDIGKLK